MVISHLWHLRNGPQSPHPHHIPNCPPQAIILNYVFVLTVTPACLVINEHWGGFEAGSGPFWSRNLKSKVSLGVV